MHFKNFALSFQNQDLLDILINLAASSKGSHRVDALIVLRNICFHQLNKYRMLSSCPFLSLLLDTLDSSHQEELRHVTYTIWSLACNSQKDKVILRNAGFEIKLEAAKRNCILKEDAETLELISMVLGILKNK